MDAGNRRRRRVGDSGKGFPFPGLRSSPGGLAGGTGTPAVSVLSVGLNRYRKCKINFRAHIDYPRRLLYDNRCPVTYGCAESVYENRRPSPIKTRLPSRFTPPGVPQTNAVKGDAKKQDAFPVRRHRRGGRPRYDEFPGCPEMRRGRLLPDTILLLYISPMFMAASHRRGTSHCLSCTMGRQWSGVTFQEHSARI